MIEHEVIHWSDTNLLNVSNFMAEPNPGIFEDSHSVIKYGFTWIVNSEQFGAEVVFSIENIQLSVEFNPLLSWIRMSEFNDNLLKHEQGHFDLAEIIKKQYQKIFENEFYHKHFPTRGQNDAQRKQFAKESYEYNNQNHKDIFDEFIKQRDCEDIIEEKTVIKQKRTYKRKKKKN